ncbi:hypothetical protein STEG23_015162, partial [Scotinomys teguina]
DQQVTIAFRSWLTREQSIVGFGSRISPATTVPLRVYRCHFARYLEKSKFIVISGNELHKVVIESNASSPSIKCGRVGVTVKAAGDNLFLSVAHDAPYWAMAGFCRCHHTWCCCGIPSDFYCSMQTWTQEHPDAITPQGPRSTRTPSHRKDPGAPGRHHTARTQEHPDAVTPQGPKSTRTPSHHKDPGTPDTIRLGGPRCNQTILDQENPEVPQTSLDQEIPEAPIIL